MIEEIANIIDPEPKRVEGPDFHANHIAWKTRRPIVEKKATQIFQFIWGKIENNNN